MTSSCNEYELPADVDPARWPFCEQRARERAALVAYPPPPMRTIIEKRLSHPTDYRVHVWQARRARQPRVLR